MIIGEIIERLIYIKDTYNITSLNDLEAINEACNVLDYRFNRFDDSHQLRDNHITSIHLMKEDIRTALKEKGFDTSEENVNKVCSYLGLKKYLQEKGIEACWDVIYNIISELKDELSEG